MTTNSEFYLSNAVDFHLGPLSLSDTILNYAPTFSFVQASFCFQADHFNAFCSALFISLMKCACDFMVTTVIILSIHALHTLMVCADSSSDVIHCSSCISFWMIRYCTGSMVYCSVCNSLYFFYFFLETCTLRSTCFCPRSLFLHCQFSLTSTVRRLSIALKLKFRFGDFLYLTSSDCFVED